jgi:FlaA1/EpsC-like NDP-sugar epimerase
MRLKEGKNVAGSAKPVLIVGAGVAGVIVADVLGKSQNKDDYEPIGFVDDDPGKQKKVLHGLPVLGTKEDIPFLVECHKIKNVIIAIPSAPGQVISQIVGICQQTRAGLKILPGFYDLITGKIKTSSIRNVEMDDLLGREPVSLDVDKIAGYLTDRKVLVTGAGGSIGSEISRQVARFAPEELILLGRGENSIFEIELELREAFPALRLTPEIGDIKDRVRINHIFEQHRPDVVFHAAAHKHVPLMERCPDEAVKNNIIGTYNLADVARRYDTGTFVLISTDKAVNPTSIMGATKRVAEMIIQSMNKRMETHFVAVRFGNVLGSRGSVIPLFKRQIAKGGPVTITHPEMMRYFMTPAEAAQLVIQAGVLANGGEIFLLDMGQPVSILDLAKNLIRLSGFEPYTEIPIEYTGIRPGEKLVEKLVAEDEGMLPTVHDRIFAVSKEKHDFANLENVLDTLSRTDFSFREQEILYLLQKVLLNFKKNSPA